MSALDDAATRPQAQRPRPALGLLAAARPALPATVALLALLAVWEGVTARAHVIPGYLLPAPSAIAAEMRAQFGYLVQQTGVTASEILLGYLLGAALGGGCALLIFYSRTLRRTLYPLVVATQYMPKLAVAPLIVVWFGLDMWPKVLVTALVCLFPIMMSVLLGLRAGDRQVLELMYVLNASRWQTFWMIRLPAALPHLFAGLKVGVTLATTGALVAEWISADAGLGYLIVSALGDFHTTLLYAALVMLLGLGLLLFGLIVLAERRLLPHRPGVEVAEHTLL